MVMVVPTKLHVSIID